MTACIILCLASTHLLSTPRVQSVVISRVYKSRLGFILNKTFLLVVKDHNFYSASYQMDRVGAGWYWVSALILRLHKLWIDFTFM